MPSNSRQPFRVRGPNEVVAVRTPPSPGPFVNAKLISLGPGRDGIERFWTSAYGGSGGAIGVVADLKGRMTNYRFDHAHECLYSAAPENADTLWLCGNMATLIRLKLNTGVVDTFPTHTNPDLPFAGMAFDANTRRLFLAAKPGGKPSGFSFDIRSKKAVQFEDRWQGKYHYNSFPNGDGTWSLVLYFPAQLVRWNPRNHDIQASAIDIGNVPLNYLYRIPHVAGRGRYIPTLGWYDATRDRLRKGPPPPHEMLWFGYSDGRMLGCQVDGTDMHIAAWDVRRNRIRDLVRLTDMQLQGVTISRDGDIAAMSVYGDFHVYDGVNGAMKVAAAVPTMPRSRTNNLCLIDRDRLLGTTFITQRFWEADLATGNSHDLGRAAPGTGQVTQIQRIGTRIYMAAYTGGELVAYDPRQPASFPANPRVVARHPLAMRPVASVHHSIMLWYACSRKYGKLGSVLSRHDTRTGTTLWAVDALGPRQVMTILHNPDTGELLCGSTIHADMGTATPAVNHAVIGRVDADNLTVRDLREAQQLRVDVIGWVRRGVALCIDYSDDDHVAYLLDATTLHRLDQPVPALPPRMAWTGRVGRFVVESQGALELHDLRKRQTLVRVIVDELPRQQDMRWLLDGTNLLLWNRFARVWVLREALSER